MDLIAFRDRVHAVFEEARDALALIETAAQENDRPSLHALSHAYARLLGPLRDYLTAAQMGKALPRQLSRRLAEPLEPIAEHEQEAIALGLKPTAQDLVQLIRDAETVA